MTSPEPADELRAIRFGAQPWRSVGYVEAVATDPEHQGQGVGRRTMEEVHAEISSPGPVALLSTGRATGFYERLGWERWRGTSSRRRPRAGRAQGATG